MGIYVGPEEISPTLTTTLTVDGELRRVQLPAQGVYVGPGIVWPEYREAFYWFEWNTPGPYVLATDPSRGWRVELPDWATDLDWVACHTGQRGEDGTRGLGVNDGYGGHAREIQYGSTRELPRGAAHARIPNPATASGDRMPGRTIALITPSGSFPRANTQTNITTAGLPRGSGASVPPVMAFGRSWPGGSGGARDQAGRPYGGGGGGGEGGPVFGNPSPKPGMLGGTGYVAWRARSGPVPDGHVWPENPDWANPQ